MELNALKVQDKGMSGVSDLRTQAQMLPRGSGPRLFCGHVPKEVMEDHVRAHFSQWGEVVDVYFPRHKKTLKRRPFCFVTFATEEAARKALAETPLNICGMPIKNVTMVEDRDKYYQDKHAASQQAMMAALQSASCPPGPMNPQGCARNLAAALAMEGVSTDALLSLLQQQQQIQTWKTAQMISPREVTITSEAQLSAGMPVSPSLLPGGLPLPPCHSQPPHPGHAFPYPSHSGPTNLSRVALNDTAGFVPLPPVASTAPLMYTQATGMSYGISMLQAATALQATSSGSFPAMTSNKSSNCSMSDKFSASSTPRNSLEVEGHVGYAGLGAPGIHQTGLPTCLGSSIPVLPPVPVSAGDTIIRVPTPFLNNGNGGGAIPYREENPADLQVCSNNASLAMQSEFYRRVPSNPATVHFNAVPPSVPSSDGVRNVSAFEDALLVQRRDSLKVNQNRQDSLPHERLSDKEFLYMNMSEPMSLTAAAISTAFSSNMDELQCSINFTSTSAAAIENSGLIEFNPAGSPSKDQHSETWPSGNASVASQK